MQVRLAKIQFSAVFNNSMNALDIIIIICYIPALIRGISKGFIEQAVALASIVASVWTASKYYAALAAWAGPFLNLSGSLINVISFIVILLAVIFLMYYVGRVITGVIGRATLGWIDRLLGLFFAIALVTVVLGIIIVFFDTVNTKLDLVHGGMLDNSVMYNGIRDIAYKIFPHFIQTPAQ